MGITSAIRGMVPPSSRSFHQMYGDLNGFRDDVTERVANLECRLDEIQGRLEGMSAFLEGSTREALDRLEAHDAHMKMLAWQLYREEGESLEDARKRFFRALPRATGVMRLLQLGSAQLLHEFDLLCRENGLDYWMYSGTLIGAERHGGFIPWDDDVDLAMPRKDIERLQRLVEDSDRFVVTTVYDWWVHCRQVRFRYKDPVIPCFLDLFFMDFSTETPKKAFELMQDDRRALLAAMNADESLEFWNATDCYLDKSFPGAERIARHFDKVVASEYDSESGFLTEDKNAAKSIIWAVDNTDSFNGSHMYFALRDVYPLTTEKFEGFDFSAPHDSPEVLRVIYGDYLELPDDLKTHIKHVAAEDIGHDSTEAIQKILH